MNRRSFLGTSGAVAGSLLAGCLNRTEDSGAQAYEPAARWAVAAEEGDPSPHDYTIATTSPSNYPESVIAENWDTPDKIEQATSYYTRDVDLADFELVVSVAPGDHAEEFLYKVITGSFDTEPIRNEIEEAGTHEGRYRQFDLYSGVEGSPESIYGVERAYAVGDGAVVRGGLGADGGSLADGVERLRRILDADAGEADRIVDRDEPLRTVASELEPAAKSALSRRDPAQETELSRSRINGVQAYGLSSSVSQETMEVRQLHLMEEEGAVERATFDELLETNWSTDEVQSSEYSIDGRLVTVTVTASVDEILATAGG